MCVHVCVCGSVYTELYKLASFLFHVVCGQHQDVNCYGNMTKVLVIV